MRALLALLGVVLLAPSAAALPMPYVDVAVDDADAWTLAVSVRGQSRAAVAVSGTGNATGGNVAFSGAGSAGGGYASASALGPSTGFVAVGGGSASSPEFAAVSLFGPATGKFVASVFGPADAGEHALAVSVFGPARGGTLALSVFDDADARILAVSGTGHATGRDSVSVCDIEELVCFNPWLVLRP